MSVSENVFLIDLNKLITGSRYLLRFSGPKIRLIKTRDRNAIIKYGLEIKPLYARDAVLTTPRIPIHTPKILLVHQFLAATVLPGDEVMKYNTYNYYSAIDMQLTILLGASACF